MHFKQTSAEVIYSDEPIVKVTAADIRWLKEQAKRNPRRRIRLCTHRDITDALHEMLIVHGREVYVRPHKHLGKPESFHVIEGTVDVVVFEEDGSVRDVIQMGEYASGRAFYYRISDPLYHTLFIRSNVLVFHETTTGPFIRAESVFAPWAPEENDHPGRSAFLARLELAVQNCLALKETAK